MTERKGCEQGSSLSCCWGDKVNWPIYLGRGYHCCWETGFVGRPTELVRQCPGRLCPEQIERCAKRISGRYLNSIGSGTDPYSFEAGLSEED